MARTASVQQAMYGNEPTPPKNQLFMDNKEYNIFLHKSFDWYNNSIKDIDKKKWVVQWGIDHGFTVSELKNIPESYLSTMGSMVRIESNGFLFNESHKTYIHSTISTLVSRFKTEKKKKVVKRKEVDNVSLVMTDFDTIIDGLFDGNNMPIKINHPLTSKNINELKVYYTTQLDYLTADEDNKFVKKYKEILKSLQSPIKPIVRKPRKKKVIPKTKQVSKLNYLKVDKDMTTI